MPAAILLRPGKFKPRFPPTSQCSQRGSPSILEADGGGRSQAAPSYHLFFEAFPASWCEGLHPPPCRAKNVSCFAGQCFTPARKPTPNTPVVLHWIDGVTPSCSDHSCVLAVPIRQHIPYAKTRPPSKMVILRFPGQVPTAVGRHIQPKALGSPPCEAL